MQNWEYKIIHETETYRKELDNRKNNEEILADAGKQGFELVNVLCVKVSSLSSIDNKEFDEMRYYFKRPIKAK